MSNSPCVLVCVTVQKECGRLIDKGQRSATEWNMPLHVLHVSPGKKALLGTPDTMEALNYLFSLAHASDAQMNIVYDADVPGAICAYAKEHAAAQVILGSDRSGIAARLQYLLPDVEIMIESAG